MDFFFQFEKLWTALSPFVSDFGNINYKEFLECYSGDTVPEMPQMESKRAAARRPTSAMMRRSVTPALQRSVTQVFNILTESLSPELIGFNLLLFLFLRCRYRSFLFPTNLSNT